MTLIYTALLCEAQSLIEKYRLTQIDNNPKTYQNGDLLVVIGGVGGINTTKTLETIYKRYTIEKGINIGIAGCGDSEVNLGEVFCTNQKLENIRYKELKTVHNPQTTSDDTQSLYDMEGSYFLEVSQKYLKNEDIFVLKVVSDHLNDTILPKDKVKKLIQNSLKSWEKWI